MKVHGWTFALAAVGLITLRSIPAVEAEEAAHQILTALSATTLSGYIDTSANWRPGNNRGPLPGRSFDGADKQDGFNLNVAGLTLEKPLDEGQWSAGYKVDLVFGPDANYFGTILNGGTTGVPNDFNIQQAYALLRLPVGNGIDIKMGVFDTIIGYESFESASNPNFSRSFGFALEPRHHTGVLASYRFNDMISVSAGVADSYFGFINAKDGAIGAADSQKTYLASLAVTVPEAAGPFAGAGFYAGIVDGRGLGNSRDSTSWYAGTTWRTPLTGLAAGAAFDYRANAGPAPSGIPPLPPLPFGSVNAPGNPLAAGNNWAWAAAGYLSYQITGKFKLNGRGDYLRGSNGTFYANDKGGDNELLGLTLTADYSLWEGLLTRLEARWDHALNGNHPMTRLFPSRSSDRNALTIALDMVYKF